MAEMQAIYHIALIVMIFTMGCGIILGLFGLVGQMIASYHAIKKQAEDTKNDENR